MNHNLCSVARRVDPKSSARHIEHPECSSNAVRHLEELLRFGIVQPRCATRIRRCTQQGTGVRDHAAIADFDAERNVRVTDDEHVGFGIIKHTAKLYVARELGVDTVHV